MTFAQRIAAAVMLTGGALVLWFMFALLGGGTVSYAQVAQQIKDARTMTFKMTISSPAMPNAVEAKLYAQEPGMMRNEGPGDTVTISRRADDKIRVLALMPKMKRAILTEMKLTDPQQAAQPNFVDEFRKLADQKGEPLAEREVGGVKAMGFKVNTDGQVVSLWADPKTARPLLVEMDVPAGGAGAKLVMSDIVFDAPLDQSLFSMNPPAGFEVQQTALEANLDLEANLINVLRVYADATGGTFPQRLDDWAAYGKAVADKSKGGKLDPATMQKVAGVGVISSLLSSRKPGEDYAYTGATARLAEKDKIIFWHRDKQTGTYRAIFADLTAREVKAEEVPGRG